MRRGFTLIEFMVSTVLILAILISSAVVIISTMGLSQLSTQKAVSVNHLNTVMEEINNTSFGDILTRNWTTWATNKRDSNGNPYFNLPGEQLVVAATPTIPTTISVRINWRWKGRTYSVDAVYQKANL